MKLAALREHRPATEDVNAALRLSQGDIRWMQTMQNLKYLTLSQRWFMVLSIIAPPRSYMRGRYNIPLSRSVWPYYPYRWWDQFRGMVRGVYRDLQVRLSRTRG